MNWPAHTAFFPVPYKPEVPGITAWAVKIVQEIGRQATLITGEPRESIVLHQQMSISLQRGNAVAFLNTFDSD